MGILGLDKGVFNARDLRVRMAPLQLQLARESSTAFPLRGILTGTATLNGSTATQMLAVGDVTHVDRGARSRAIGRATIRGRGVPWVDNRCAHAPLSLATSGARSIVRPSREPRAVLFRLRGSLINLAVNTDLTSFPDGGFLACAARLIWPAG